MYWTDEAMAYAAGAVEGRLTADLTYWHWLNTVSGKGFHFFGRGTEKFHGGLFPLIMLYRVLRFSSSLW